MAKSTETRPMGTPEQPVAGWDSRHHKWAAFGAGILAGMVMTVVMLLLLVTGITPRSLANIVADKLASTAGAGIAEFFIQAIGALGKESLFFGIVIGQVVVGGVLGLLFALVTDPTGSRRVVWRNGLILSGGLWLFFMLVIFPLAETGFFAGEEGRDQLYLVLSTLGLFLIFGVVMALAFMLLVPYRAGSGTTSQENNPSASNNRLEPLPEWMSRPSTRRGFAGLIGAVFVVVAGVAFWPKFFAPYRTPYKDRKNFGKADPNGQPEGQLTSNEDFYQVSKNAFNPPVDGGSWKLEIDGLVERPLSLSLADLNKLPQQEIYHTLYCISNQVGGELLSTAKWTGMPFHTLLEQAGVKLGVVRVMFTSADGYTDSIPIEKALEPNTFLVLKMNGDTLPVDHGYPARMLIPDIYGMKNAKWLTKVTLIDHDFKGYWQLQGWNNTAQINTSSTIVWPTPSDKLAAGQSVTVRGTAFAGLRPIEKVEVSTDGGQNWQTAQLKDKLGPHTWTLWELNWTPVAQAKPYQLVVRAYEQGGKLQTNTKAEPFPNGSSGLHMVNITTV